MRDTFTLWDIGIDKVNNSQAERIFRRLMEEDSCEKRSPLADNENTGKEVHIIATPNSEIIANALKDKELKEIMQNASLVIPDGIGLVYASRILKNPLSERVTGIDFLNSVFAYLEEKEKGVFLLGGSPGPLISVAEKAGEEIQKKFPSLKISGSHHGYFGREEEERVVDLINKSDAEFLCVAMGSPRQEKFISRHKREFTNIRCAMGVGGSLDVWAGNVKRAPDFYRDHGLEWLYRAVKEPVRVKRLFKLPPFMFKVFLISLKNSKGD